MTTRVRLIELAPGGATDAEVVDRVMAVAFDPRYGEAWTRSQCVGILAMPGVWMTLARVDEVVVGFALVRAIMDEAELLLIAVDPAVRRTGVGAALLRGVIAECDGRGVAKLHLEVRANNPAITLYTAHGFHHAGVRRGYYHGRDGATFDAHTYVRNLSAER
ncbi:ribosomal-protein-alanine acetyltransferase [Sphingomonas sp. Leaf231]|uniref:ribosomal protein S18-alanine N-acetyltransferase n=1 Tax=Sphingomonas sp. Leaf231 TaxID=1736301 RepID=UPI0006FED442|nr:ribosomal protein S18-alanine N-acetyltransferase [Sphingomonas sp. Leaf231]KQN92659.1 ribosomal-protein-alanine acetyltransferase [Sphingomonas sp. Leaf231]